VAASSASSSGDGINKEAGFPDETCNLGVLAALVPGIHVCNLLHHRMPSRQSSGRYCLDVAGA
jgi:hypothetical protein